MQAVRRLIGVTPDRCPHHRPGRGNVLMMRWEGGRHGKLFHASQFNFPVDVNALKKSIVLYSAFRQKFPKLWTSLAHSFLHQIAQNKS